MVFRQALREVADDNLKERTLRVGVAMLNWGAAENTIRCVSLLLEGTRAPDLIVVHDNGSPGDSADRIARAASSLRLLRSGTNIGFAAGMNHAVSHALAAGMDGVWILNNDTVPTPDCLAVLSEALFAAPGTAAVTGRILHPGPPPTLRYAGAEYDERLMHYAAVGSGERDAGQHGLARDVPFVSGCCMLVTRRAWESIGPFFEPFFAYWEDADWCLRATRAGHRLRYEPRAVLTHVQYGGAAEASPFRFYLHTRNHFYFIRRHAETRVRRAACLARAMRRYLWTAVCFARQGRMPAAVHTMAGIADGCLRIGAPLFFRVPKPS
jgi:GT2 family glycosyltransferase